MATSKTNISKIDKYVKGRLSARDMHQVERETYDDAFLNEAMEGFEDFAADDHEETIGDLKAQLAARVSPSKTKRLVLRRTLSVAASVLLIFGLGYWFARPKDNEGQSKKYISKIKPSVTGAINKVDKVKDKQPVQSVKRNRKLIADNLNAEPSITYKTDTIEYAARDYKTKANASIDELLKKVEGFEIDTTGAVLFNGQQVAKARLNGKDYLGGDVNNAIQSLPADIIDKLQVVDDYGSQAGRTGVRSGEPDKILNLTTGSKKSPLSTNGFFNKPLLYMPQVIYKEDTIEYVTNNYPIVNKAKAIVLMLNNGFERDRGIFYYQGNRIKNFKINNKETVDKNWVKLVEKLPADVLEKIQVIDNYSDMATRGFRSVEPDKVLNLVVRDIKNRRLPWAYKLNGVTVPGDTVERPKPAIGWKRYAAYVAANVNTSAKSGNELMVFFYVAPDGTLSDIRVIGYGNAAQYERAVAILKNGPAWVGYKEPRQIWIKFKLKKE